jgi:murein L,D-transpeptidase YcbB/YkuD
MDFTPITPKTHPLLSLRRAALRASQRVTQRAAILALGALGALGCSGQVATPSDPAHATSPDTPPAPDPALISAAVERVCAALPDALAAAVEPPASTDQTPAQVAQALQQLSAIKGPSGLNNLSTLKTYYAAMQHKPIFVLEGRLTPAARAAFTAISDAPRHGLDPASYHLTQLDALISQAPSSEPTDTSEALTTASTLTEPERDALTRHITQHPDLLAALNAPDPTAALTQLTSLLLSDTPQNPLPRLALAKTALHDAASHEAAVDLGTLEVLLADAFLSFSRDLSLGNLHRFTDAERRTYKVPMGEEIDPSGKNAQALVSQRLMDALSAFDNLQGDAASADALLRSLWPLHPQYAKLLDARARYAAFVTAGGWQTVAAGKLNPKGKAPRVKLLKARLAAEGFYSGPIDDVFDSTLTDAISRYQETHQLEVSGTVEDKQFWGSLNIPADERLKQIDVNLRRWRQESRIIPSDYYIYTNIPDFHSEIWRNGERQMRFRIVVGNTHRACDERTRTITYDNATPLQHARLSHVIFNPYWNVPPRIEQEEYLPKMAENPNWLQENGFEYVTNEGNTHLRQLPGPGNALGVVKFIFPNKHNTYMHDTPQKSLFKYPVRAFSHGCMRVHEPMKFAEHLLTADGKWDAAKVDRIFASSKEQGIKLDTPLDVFVEYHTVRVADDGGVHFLADVYKLVRRDTHPNEKFDQRCTPKAKEVFARPTDTDDGGLDQLGGFSSTGP